MHARFGTSRVIEPGTPTAHVIYNDPQIGEVDLYSTLQNLAAYSDLPRSMEVPPGDPDYATPSQMTSSNLAFIQNRCWIYDAALAIIVLTVAGLWEAALTRPRARGRWLDHALGARGRRREHY
ncbi:MAG: hypothetical protein LAO07_19160 [Acidobacteriia bacterium]|nr:hypothetical protein [Terriglobia bacterium]